MVTAGGSYYFYNRSANAGKQAESTRSPGAPPSRNEEVNIPGKSARPSTVFKGGDQGFIPLKLESVEVLNHNTKKFRFKLPESDNISGLDVACKFR